MAVTVTKAKAKESAQKPQASTDQSEEAQTLIEPSKMTIEQLADKYGSLEDQIGAIEANPLFAQFKEIKEELETRIADYEPTDTLKIKGHHWIIEIGAAARNPTKLKDAAGLRSILGDALFFKIAKVTVGDVNKYCTPEQASKVLDEDTGYSSRRKITSSFIG